MTPAPLVVLCVVGLTPKLLAHMPRVRAVGQDGFQAQLDPPLPAVTCTSQATFLTGDSATSHGIVGNGWYFRDLGEVLLWRQHNALIGGEKVWDTARRARPDLRVANLCWWYAMGAAHETLVTPRPVYHSDGRKSPDCYTVPPALRDELTAEFGRFPLFHYWGPGANASSSRWIGRAAAHVYAKERPELSFVYLPHLDYDLQRFGPDGPEAIKAAEAVDQIAGDLIDSVRADGAEVVVLSEYGITPASRPIDVNRALRRAGLLEVYTQEGMEYLDPWTSRAFAVADHQIAHVYVKDPKDIDRVQRIVSELEGVEQVLDADGKRQAGLDHDRAGELVLVADQDSWFTYYYWLDDRSAPDFARMVEIHRKPGYDPAELFLDPADPLVKPRLASKLARKALGFRYTLDVIPLDATVVKGSHGRLPDDPMDGPVLLSSTSAHSRSSIGATEVKGLLLDHLGVPEAGR